VFEPRRLGSVSLVGSHDEIGVKAGDLALETSALVLRSVEAESLVVGKPAADLLQMVRNESASTVNPAARESKMPLTVIQAPRTERGQMRR